MKTQRTHLPPFLAPLSGSHSIACTAVLTPIPTPTPTFTRTQQAIRLERGGLYIARVAGIIQKVSVALGSRDWWASPSPLSGACGGRTKSIVTRGVVAAQ